MSARYALTAALALAACEPGATLTVTVTGADEALLTLTGPDGFSDAAVGGATWSGLADGAYTLDAAPAGDLVPDPAHQEVTLAAGDEVTLTIAYGEPDRAITLDLDAPSVFVGHQLTFHAALAGVEPADLVWTVTAGTANGLVTPTQGDDTSAFIAYMTPGDCVVGVHSETWPEVEAHTTVHVVSASALFVDPATLVIGPNLDATFTAWLDGAPTADVVWTLEGADASVWIDGAGELYTGDVGGSFFVRATTRSEPPRTATSAVTVQVDPTLQIVGPRAATISELDAVTLYAALSPQSVERNLIWDLPQGGSVVDVAWYQAFLPDGAGSYPVTVSLAQAPSATDTIVVAVEAAPSARRFDLAAGPGARAQHAAARLQDGSVLVTGGWDARGGRERADAARYDPVRRTFTPVAAPPGALPGAVATALPDGRVLLTGGVTAWNEASDLAWLYDPRADAWTVAGTMSARRADHAAVLVTAGPDAGSVLILGGGNGPVPYGDPAWQATASVDRFDPATGRLAPWTPLNDARAKFAIAALPDGTFLVTGGVTTLAVGAVPTAERVNTLTGSVDRLSGMNRPRYGHTATPLPDGRVLIAGDGSAERYDPATGTFDPIAARPLRARNGATATATSDGRVLFAGGEEEDLLWGSVESWDPTAGGFVFVGGLQTPRTGHTATLLTSGPDAGAVLVLGGELTATQASVAELVR